MEQVRKWIEQREYKQAYAYLTANKNDTAEYYIYMASVCENLGYIESALKTAEEGIRIFPDNYELVFMLGNYSLYEGKPEKAYVQYLLAEYLCGTQDREIIQENRTAVDTENLDGTKASEELQKVIRERILLGEYERIYGFVSDIIFGGNRFLFEKVIDQWIRYYYIILEMTACERKRGVSVLTANKYMDCREFEKVLREYKFTYRCIWFGFLEESRKKVTNLLQKYDDSADFWAVAGKCSVPEIYVADVLEKTAELIKESGRTEKAEGISRYACAFKGINVENREVFYKECVKKQLEVHYLDAEQLQTPGLIPSAEKDKNKAAFILCANDKRYVEEVLMCLQYQNIPENYRISVFVIYHAKSMAQGYNIGMAASDAKYKIYIHQDTFLYDTDYTKRIIHLLETSGYQMLGVAGTEKMPGNGIWWDSPAQNKHLCLYQDWTLYMLRSVTDTPELPVIPVECLDGVLIATCIDLAWREDIFTNFHFYDVSQGMEFIKNGCRAGVINCEDAGVLHEVSVGKSKLTQQAYEESRRRFIEEYKK